MGAYASKEKPKVIIDYMEEEEEDSGSPLSARGYRFSVSSYNTRGGTYTYYFKEKPTLIAKARSYYDLMKAAPTIFSGSKGAKMLDKAKVSDGECAFLYQGPGGYLVIAIDND